MECAFCNNTSIGERKISENDLAWAFPTNIPITPGHTLVIPKRHVANITEMTLEERAAILDLAEKIKSALRKVFNAQGFNIAWNEEKVAGQSVPHFHLHIVPRTEGDTGIIEYEPRKFLYRPGSREESPQHELESVAASIRGAL
ncbi:MAG TPA: HIT family protein [Candidatus Paceibacterota bacterium]|nr:HIT family protein [Candidatus Paceibacterota bacterium]